jgi:hypothetical protein
MKALIEDFERLRHEWVVLRQRRLDDERASAPRHNFIRLLCLQRAEIGFHSPFLRDLLDPYGSHGQGLLFLKSFLEMIGRNARRCDFQWSYRWPDIETDGAEDWIVLGEHGKIDISIRNRKQRVLIFIENKIDAQEQYNQLTRYQERLGQERHSYDHRLLTFLSPAGYKPISGVPDVHITYEVDMSTWIEDAMRQVPTTAVSLMGNLCQYVEVIRSIRSERVGTMADKELIDLIMKPENIIYAWDIYDCMGSAEKALYLRFWDGVETSLVDSLKKLNLDGSWRVNRIGDIENRPSDNNRIEVARIEAHGLTHLYLTIIVESKRIYGGIAFSVKQPHPHPKPQIRALRDLLPTSWKGSESWWIGYYDTSYQMPSRDLLRDLAGDVISVVQPMTDALMEILKVHLPAVIAADDALRAVPAAGTSAAPTAVPSPTPPPVAGTSAAPGAVPSPQGDHS